jgi:intracellular sulfur oxidation DsrE/DsrF family protein
MLARKSVAAALLSLALLAPAMATNPAPRDGLKIDVPVQLKPSKVAFNMDHPAFAGDQSIGLAYMRLMIKNYRNSHTPLEVIAVFHGALGYMLLNDEVYNKVRKSDKGNPYKDAIAALQKEGVQFEECGQTARANSWVNADLLPDVKVNSGANLRLIQLEQDGYIQIHP